MFRLLFLCVTVGVVVGTWFPFNQISVDTTQRPNVKPCQTEAQWEGRASEWNHIKEDNNRYKISFDGVGLRKRVIKENKSFMPGERRYEYIMEYKTDTLYTINLNYDTCTVTNLTQPWQNHTIPFDATLEDEYELGAPGSGFKVREWSDRIPARRAESWIGIFTIDGCWPVLEVVTDDDVANRISLTTRFFDLLPGIANMSVFDPPDICKPKYEWQSDSESEFEPELDFDPPITNQYRSEMIGATEEPALLVRGWRYVKSWFD